MSMKQIFKSWMLMDIEIMMENCPVPFPTLHTVFFDSATETYSCRATRVDYRCSCAYRLYSVLEPHEYIVCKVANPARGQLNRKKEKRIFPCPRSRLGIWSRETGSAAPSRVSLLISILRLNRVLYYGISPNFRGGVHFLFKPPYVNGSVPSLSGQSRVYRATQLRTDGVHCRESAGTGPVNLKVVPVTGAALAGHRGPNNMRLSFPHPLLV